MNVLGQPSAKRQCRFPFTLAASWKYIVDTSGILGGNIDLLYRFKAHDLKFPPQEAAWSINASPSIGV